jgi:hypothetical protein
MDIAYAGILLLTAFLVIYTGWRAIPLLLFAVLPGQIRASFLDPDEAQRLTAAAPDVQARLADLKALGFGIMGIMAEKAWWRRPALEVVANSVEKSAFAAVVLGPAGQAVGVYFYTPLAGGGLVFTRARSPLPEMETADTSVKDMPGASVDKLWVSHRRRLQALRERGQRPLPVDDQAARLAASRAYYASAYGRRARRIFLRSAPVVNFLVVFALLIAILAIYVWRAPVR